MIGLYLMIIMSIISIMMAVSLFLIRPYSQRHYGLTLKIIVALKFGNLSSLELRTKTNVEKKRFKKCMIQLEKEGLVHSFWASTFIRDRKVSQYCYAITDEGLDFLDQ